MFKRRQADVTESDSPTPSQVVWAPCWSGCYPASNAKPAGSNPHFSRMMQRVPYSLYATFTPEQLAALAWASIPDKSNHIIEYRRSLSLFRKTFYLTVFFGREKRSLARLAAEGQISLRKARIAHYVSVSLTAAGLLLLIAIFFVALGLFLEFDIQETQSKLPMPAPQNG